MRSKPFPSWSCRRPARPSTISCSTRCCPTDATAGCSSPIDKRQNRKLVLKFPHPRVASEGSYRLAFVREAWVAARVRSLWIGEIIEVPAGRQTRLYSVMPLYEGETLEQRLNRSPQLSLTEGIGIATKLARAVATLHRAGIIHRDIKPDNVILLAGGGLRLVDLGVARVPLLEDFPAEDIPGTASYMAPELFSGRAGRRILRSLCARRDRLSHVHRRLSLWRDRAVFAAALRQAVSAVALPARSAGLARRRHRQGAQCRSRRSASATSSNSRTNWKTARCGPKPGRSRHGDRCYDRNPLMFWKLLCAFLMLVIVIILARH